MTTKAKEYLLRRIREVLVDGFIWDGRFVAGDYNSTRVFLEKGGQKYQAVYLPEEERGNGRYRGLLSNVDLPVITNPNCKIASYYDYHNIPYIEAGQHIKEWPEYVMVSEFYEDKKADRSGQDYMNHIDEGLAILKRIGSNEFTMRDYCLHPLFQMDEDLKNNTHLIKHLCPHAVMHAMEYRNIANSYLSRREIDSIDEIMLSPIDAVNEMLVADKVQNYKDFLKYHKGTHKRSDELDEYFHNWFERLDIDYEDLVEPIKHL